LAIAPSANAENRLRLSSGSSSFNTFRMIPPARKAKKDVSGCLVDLSGQTRNPADQNRCRNDPAAQPFVGVLAILAQAIVVDQEVEGQGDKEEQ